MSLINIIVPCYNGAKYLNRFFISLLNQDFQDFDVFFVDDGSTDNTREVAESYIDKFLSKGIILHYLFKENGGAASAVNLGLRQELDGKYVFILDSDDEVPSHGLSARVDFMEKHPTYGACTGFYKFIDNDTKKVIGIQRCRAFSHDRKSTLKNIITVKNIAFPGYFFNKEKLFSVLKNNQIYESRQGQNWQLLIPVASKFQIGVIKKVMYNYYVIKTSHSHSTQNTKTYYLQRIDGLCDILKETLYRSNLEQDFYKYIEIYKYRCLISAAYRLGDRGLMKSSFAKYKQLCKFVRVRELIKYCLVMLKIRKK